MSRKRGTTGRRAATPVALVAATAGGGGRPRSVLPRLGRRRRHPSWLKMARRAGTVVSAIGMASDVLAQINALSEVTRRPGASPDHRIQPPEEETP